MATIEVDPKVKEKLTQYKKESGSKTYSDAINLLLEIRLKSKR